MNMLLGIAGILLASLIIFVPTLSRAADAAKILDTNEFITAHSNLAVLGERLFSTTDAYRREALRRVIEEANSAASELHLPEALPITVTNLVEQFIPPYGVGQYLQAIGNVTTSNYVYCVSVGRKLSYVIARDVDEERLRLTHQYAWPAERLDTNAALYLATQWLAAASMDVPALNRDCELRIITKRVRTPGTNVLYLPDYWVVWTKGGWGHGSVAYVEVFLPTRKLMDLSVEDSKYILRKPIEFTNIDALMAGSSKITNWLDVHRP